jgi:hypothetical protein
MRAVAGSWTAASLPAMTLPPQCVAPNSTNRSEASRELDERQMKKIAVLGWGSLVWEPGGLNAAPKFASNGPLLPIEFCRVSDDGRLTLVIDETYGALCATYSAPSAIQDLDAAIDNLRLREGMPNARGIGFVETASGKQSDIALQRHPEAVATIAAWATSNSYDAVIWTALASNFDEPDKGGEPFSVTAAIRYLETLEGRDAAKFAWALAYVRNAPPEVQTPVRQEVAKRWPG